MNQIYYGGLEGVGITQGGGTDSTNEQPSRRGIFTGSDISPGAVVDAIFQLKTSDIVHRSGEDNTGAIVGGHLRGEEFGALATFEGLLKAYVIVTD